MWYNFLNHLRKKELYKMIIKRFLRALKTYSDNRTAYWQLMNMTDRQLNDLGICRGDIKRLTIGG